MLLKNMICEIKKEKLRKQKEQRTKKIIGITASLAVTAISGVIGGLMMAPKSGKELREDIAKTANDANENLKKDIEAKKEKLSSGVNETRNKINSYLAAKKEKNDILSEENEELEDKAIETEVVEEKIVE